MSLDDIESASYGATPLQLFIFEMGNVTMGLVGGTSRPYTWNNTTFAPDALVELGEINQSLAEATPSVEIPVQSDSAVAQLFIPYLPPEPIQVRVLRLNGEQGAEEYAVEFIGEVVSSSFDQSLGVCTLIARMVSSAMSRPVPWCVFSSNCTRMLGGAGCDVNLNDYRTDAILAGGANGVVLSAAGFATAAADHGVTDPEAADEWFKQGYVRHVASNEVRTIIAHSGSEITLRTPFTRAATGDEVQAFAGCNRSSTHCSKKFNNLDNQLAFSWMPGRNPYTQTVYGNETASQAKSKTDWHKAINPAGWNGSWGLF